MIPLLFVPRPDLQARATVSLTALSSSDAGSRPFTLLVSVTPPEGWHTYWKNPGESGAPTKIELDLPAGWKARAKEWPAPTRLTKGGETTFVYDRTTNFEYVVSPVGNPSGKIVARVSGLICEEACVPMRETASLEYPTAEPVSQTYGDLSPTQRPPVRYRVEAGDILIDGLPALKDAFDFGSTLDPARVPVRSGTATRFGRSAYAKKEGGPIRLLVVPVDGLPFTVVAFPKKKAK